MSSYFQVRALPSELGGSMPSLVIYRMHFDKSIRRVSVVYKAVSRRAFLFNLVCCTTPIFLFPSQQRKLRQERPLSEHYCPSDIMLSLLPDYFILS